MSGLEMKYFVLKPKSSFKNDIYAAVSREAIRNYANNIKSINPILSQELINWVNIETDKAMNLIV